MSIAIFIVVSLLFLLGILGTIIPALPGIGLVYGGILVYAFSNHFTAITPSTVVVLGIVSIIAASMQYLGSAWAARSAGGQGKALAGTVLGALIGATTGPVGIFGGAFLGALIGALLEGSSTDRALRIALKSVIGILGGSIMQFLFALALIGAFLVAIFF
jgi:uncharacterized protein YqgC (DUF456 family)